MDENATEDDQSQGKYAVEKEQKYTVMDDEEFVEIPKTNKQILANDNQIDTSIKA